MSTKPTEKSISDLLLKTYLIPSERGPVTRKGGEHNSPLCSGTLVKAQTQGEEKNILLLQAAQQGHKESKNFPVKGDRHKLAYICTTLQTYNLLELGGK